jgi:hypothetical protein
MPMRQIDKRQSPEQVDILFSCNERVYDPKNAPMARQDSSPSLIILSVHQAESSLLVVKANSGGYKKITISNTDDCQ